MRKPIDIVEAEKRHLLATKANTRGIHTFSNGTAGYGWMECNCFECWFYADDCV